MSRGDSPAPNVVPPEAAALLRALIYDRRHRPSIAPVELAEQLLQRGAGGRFDPSVRASRVLTWVKQVLNRLRKKGWVRSGDAGEWSPAPALRDCRDPAVLARTAPKAPAGPAPAGRAAPPPPVESWAVFVERWVFERRKAPFAIGDLVGDMLRRGFGDGAPERRLREARRVAERELGRLQHEILLDRDGDFWHPTELLRSWPSA